MNLPTLKTKHDSLYEPMSSEISAGVFKPHRDSCSQCGTSFMSHFFVTCTCNLSYCCACLSLNDYCMDCHMFLGAGSTFTKTPMFAKHIGGHNCYLQKDDQTMKYGPGLKDLLFSSKVHRYKECSSLLTLFTEQKLDEEVSNFVFRRIYTILTSLECGQITFYDDLFREQFLNKYRTQIKKNLNFYSNITKIKFFKKGTNFAEDINFFLNFGENYSKRSLLEQKRVKSYDAKVMYLKMFFIFVLTTMILIVIVSKF